MAALSRTIEIVFSGSDKFSGTADSVNSKVAILAGGLESGVSAAASFTSTLLTLETALVAAGAAIATVAFNESVAFESALLDLGKVLKEGEGDLTAYGDQMVDLALQFGVSSSELVQSQANFVQAGFTAADAAQLVADSLNLVIAGDISAAESSDLLVASLKGFNEPASEAARLVDVLNETSNNYATNVRELAVGMANISPIASQMGFSFEETAGILTPVIEVFRSGSEASTALKTGLLKLIDDSKPVEEALTSIGVAQRDANGNLRSGKDILNDVAQAFTHIDDNQKLFITSQLVGIEQGARMVQVFDNLAKSSEITATAMNASGSAANEVAIRLASSEVQIKRAQVAFAELATVIGDQFRVELTGVISATGGLADSFRQVVAGGGLAPLFDLLKPQLIELEQLLTKIAENLPEAFEGVDFSRLTDAIGDAGGALRDLFDVDLSTVDGLRDLIQQLVDGIAALTQFTAGAINAIGPFIEKAGDLLDIVINLDPGFLSLAGSVGGVATALNVITPSLNTALLAFVALGGAQGAIPKLGAALAAIPAGIGTVTSSIGALISALNGPAGLVIAAGAAGAAVGSVIFDMVDSNEAFIDTTDNIFGFVDSLLGIESGADRAAKEVATAAISLDGLGQKTDKTSGSLESAEEQAYKLGQQLNDTGKITNVTADQLDAATEAADLFAKQQKIAADALKDSSEAFGEIGDGLSDYEAAVQGLAPVTQEIADQWRESAGALDELNVSQGRVAITMEGGVTVFTQVARATGEVANSLENLAETGEIAKDKYAELLTEIKKEEIRAQVQLDIAQLEANTEIAKAELESIREIAALKIEFDIEQIKQDTERVKSLITGITDAAEIVSSNIQHVIDAIAGLDASDELAQDKFQVFREQLEIENRRLDEQLANQTRLVNAQVDELNARTERLKRGDSVIEINGAGLQPHLEAFMFEILSAIQVRANSDAQAFLLGL